MNRTGERFRDNGGPPWRSAPLTHRPGGRTIGAMGIELEPVHGTVSAPILDAGPAPDERDTAIEDRPPIVVTPASELPWPGLRHGSIHSLELAAPVVAGSAVVLATGNPGFGAGSGLIVGAVWLLRSIAVHVQFSFGDGFVGYRPDPRWPQGVQEDDDVHWDWRDHAEPDDE